MACVGLANQYDEILPGECDHFASAGVVQLGRWVRLLRRWGASEAILIGRVHKARMYDPARLWRQLPDWRAIRLWYRILRHDRRSQVLLAALTNELERDGIQLIDTTRYIPEHIAEAGLLTRSAPSVQHREDIAFAQPLLRQLNAMDIGQALAVKERDVIAVEAMEGTDMMIERAGQLCRSGNWVLVKGAGASKDLRFDVPTVGVTTIENLHAAGGRCLAVTAGRVIFADKQRVIETADRLSIAIVGIEDAKSIT